MKPVFVETTEKGLVRDINTMCISNTNVDHLNKYKAEKQRQQMVTRLNDEMDQLKAELSEIKSLLKKVVGQNV